MSSVFRSSRGAGPRRRIRRGLVLAASGALALTVAGNGLAVASPTGPTTGQPGSAPHATPAPTPTPTPSPTPPPKKPVKLTVTGHGWGHGRGLGQYGALGYAVNYGWSSAQILDHYYGGTRAGTVTNPTIGVELQALSGGPVRITGGNLRVNGKNITNGIKIEMISGGNFQVYSGPGCGGPWKPWMRVTHATVQSMSAATNPTDAVQVCRSSYTRGYRGHLEIFNGGGRMITLNRVKLESYLRSVVPSESPSSWGSAGGGKGMAALEAQAVAARSYVMAGSRTYSRTCDTVACQVYSGFFKRYSWGIDWLEDSRSNQAVTRTAGVVRRMNSTGKIARTEFSSSTGGWTAGGTFAAVVDDGDAVADNPNHNWSKSMSWASLESRIGKGTLAAIAVTTRNGLGAEGGRVLKVTVTTTSGAKVTYSASTIRRKLGLKSDWFSLVTTLG